MVTGDRVREAFDLTSEDPQPARPLRPAPVRPERPARAAAGRGGQHLRHRSTPGYWDHHNDIEKNLEEHLPPLDAAIATLVEDLERPRHARRRAHLLRRRVRPHAAHQRPRRPRPLVQLLFGAARRRRTARRASRGRRERTARRQGPRPPGLARSTCWPPSIRRWASRWTRTSTTPPAAPSASSATASRCMSCCDPVLGNCPGISR